MNVVSSGSAGGKAEWLRRLETASFSVPRFGVIPERLSRASGEALWQWAVGSLRLRPPFAVRSSANVEDGADAAYPGIFDTRLGVGDPEELAAAVEAVLASATSAVALGYHARHGDATAEPKMSVIVQELVEARTAGVCLVRALDSPHHIVIDAVRGLGALLVGGEVEPDTYCLDADLAEQDRRRGSQIVQMLPSGLMARLDHLVQRRWVLTDRDILAVGRIALEIDRTFQLRSGSDIEWAIDGNGRLVILQLRPLTNALAMTAPPAA